MAKYQSVFTLKEDVLAKNSEVDFERELISRIMSDETLGTYQKVRNTITRDVFTDEHCKIIFDAITAIINSSKPSNINIVTIAEYLHEQNILGKIITSVDIFNVIDDSERSLKSSFRAPTEDIANILVTLRDRRVLYLLQSQFLSEINTDKFNVYEKAKEISFKFSELAAKQHTNIIPSTHVLASETMKFISDTMEGLIFSYKFGFTALDDLTGGFYPGDLVYIGARPAVGKTAFALSIANNMALDDSHKVLFMSLEMTRVQILMRLASMQTDIPLKFIRSAELTGKEYNQVGEFLDGKYSQNNLFIYEPKKNYLDEILFVSEKAIIEQNVDVIIIDYIQNISTGQREQSRATEIEKISKHLKLLAKNNNVLVITLAQLNRKIEETKRDPVLADLRDSGSIEQDGDVIMFLIRPEAHGDNFFMDGSAAGGLARIKVTKHRNGPVGFVDIGFKKECTKFYDLDKYRYERVMEANKDLFKNPPPF